MERKKQTRLLFYFDEEFKKTYDYVSENIDMVIKQEETTHLRKKDSKFSTLIRKLITKYVEANQDRL